MFLPIFQPNQHSTHRSRREKPALSMKADMRGLQKCKTGPLFSLNLFLFGEIFFFIMSYFMKQIIVVKKNYFL